MWEANGALAGLQEMVRGAQQVVLAFSAVFALLNCFFGYKLIKIWAALAGFALGWVLGFAISLGFVENTGACALIGVAAGVALGAVAFFLYRVGVFLFCFYLGASFCLAFIPGWPGALAGVAAGILVGVLAMKFLREVLILTSAFSGGMNAANGLLALFGVTAAWAVWAMGLVLAGLGALAQWKTTGSGRGGIPL